jgi:uncharacterized protein DUF3592
MTLAITLAPWANSLVGIAMLTAGAGFGVSTVRDLTKSLQCRRWPSTSGEILESSTEQASRGFQAILRYRYQVNGKEYIGRRLFFGDSLERSAEVIKKRISGYPLSEKVKVFHDPSRPHQSVLEPWLHWSDWVMGAVIPVGCVVLGVLFLGTHAA